LEERDTTEEGPCEVFGGRLKDTSEDGSDDSSKSPREAENGIGSAGVGIVCNISDGSSILSSARAYHGETYNSDSPTKDALH
jgi:hypothetical protein